MRPALEAEKIGIPSVVVTTTGFSTFARVLAKASGIENLSIAEYPGAVGNHHPDEIREKVQNVLFDRVIDGLTTSEETPARIADTAWNPREVVFGGTLEQINTYFRNNEWADGLPIIPPTAERVEEFLKYTDRSPNEEVAVLAPAHLKAVPWNIAVNAVMAGCQPEHMPLIIAAVEALADDNYHLNNIGSSSALWPYVLVNGPIVGQLGIEAGGQLISKGPNPAIGRAIGLIVRNIAGYRPGDNYMGTFGYPMVFTLAENDKESPWEPFHVEHGFDREMSTVTLGITNNWGHAPAPSSKPEKSGTQIILEILCKELAKKFRLHANPGRGSRAAKLMITLLLAPPVAKTLAASGYSKQRLKAYLYENAKLPLGEFQWAQRYTSGLQTTEEIPGDPNEMVRLLPSPDDLHIIVCGDPNRNRMMSFEGAHAQPTTKLIKLPPGWANLLEERRLK